MARLSRRDSLIPARATTPPPPPTGSTTGFGIAAAPGDFFGKNSTQIDAILTDYQYLGLKWTRIAIDWPNVQSTQGGAYSWTQYDTLLARLAAKNIRPIILCSGSTPWSRDPATVPPAGWEAVVPPTLDMDGFASFCAAVANKYAAQNPVLEIWNEPNIPSFWRPGPNVADYTTLLKKAYTAIKAVQPSLTVITAGLTLGWDDGTTVVATTFLAGIYSNGGKNYFDGVGWHPYQWHNVGSAPYTPGGAADATQPWYQMYGTANSARTQMTAQGDSAKKIWCTEYGAHTSFEDQVSATDAQQASLYTAAVQQWSSYTWSAAFNFYTFKDSAAYGASGDNEKYFGLWLVTHTDGVTNSATEKPSVAAVKSAITTSGW